MNLSDEIQEENKAHPLQVIPSDLSPRVIELARVLDRLPPGEHIITFSKPEVRAKEWDVLIVTVQKNRHMRLPKRAT